MESWRNGRREATEEFNKVLDRIEAELESEFDQENNITITRDRHRLLSDRSARTEELEDNIKVLGRRNQALEARLKDVQLSQDKSVENDRLVKENTRLAKELENHQNTAAYSEELEHKIQRLSEELGQSTQRQWNLEKTAAQCGELEEENQRLIEELDQRQVTLEETAGRSGELETEIHRLMGELNQATNRQRDLEERAGQRDELEEENRRLAAELDLSVQRLNSSEKDSRGRDEGTASKVAISTNDNPPSASSVVASGLGLADARNYDALATKYNRVYGTLKDSNAARAELAKQIQILKGKRREWVAWSDSLEKDKAKLADKIERLEEQVQTLRKQAGSSSSTIVPTSSTRSAVQQYPVGSLEDFIRATKAVPHDPIYYNGKLVELVDLLKSLLSPELKSSLVEIPNSPVRRPSPNGLQSFNPNTSDRLEQSEPLPDQDYDLPMPLRRQGPHNPSVEDTQFELMEAHHTRQDDSNPPGELPNDADLENRGEQLPEIPSSPVVISTRIVKKRKNQKGPSQPVTVSKVKVETISSSPLSLVSLLGLEENIDLDEIGEKQHTPRKRKAGRNFMSFLTPEGTSAPMLSNDSGYHTTARTPANKSALGKSGAALRPLSTNKKILPRASDERPNKKRRVVTDLAIDELADDGENSQGFGLGSEKVYAPEFIGRVSSLLQGPRVPAKTTLSPRDLTRSTKGNTNNKPMLTSKSNLKSADRIFELQPDDDDSFDDLTTPAFRSSANITGPRSNSVSGDTSYGSRASSRDSPTHRQIIASNDPSLNHSTKEVIMKFGSSVENASKDSPSAQQSTRRSVNYPKTTVKKRKSRAAEEIFNADVDHPDNEPLRTRPVDKLHLDDFVINKKYNQGFSYAYKDVVRGKAQRSCLQGCTKPECCGKQFELLAKLELDNQQPLTFSQKDSNNALLSEFLGENGYKLRTMTKEERADVLLKAKTREMANKYGRHRHAYQERATPPGFWRIDFPNTQEGDEDREKARLLERNLVEQRYQEAMRPNGPYIFRDELEK